MDCSHFFEHGYQVFRGILPAVAVNEVRRWLQGDADRMLEEIRQIVMPDKPGALAGAIVDCCEKNGHQGLDADLRNALSGHFPLATRLGQPLRSLLRCGSFHTLLRNVLEDEHVRVHMPPMARFVLPQNRMAGVPPHQDVSYNRHLSDFIVVWVPLVPIDDRCGGVTVYHGTRDVDELLPAEEHTSRNIWLKGIQNLEKYPQVRYAMEPGDVLVFTKMVVHASMPNISDRMRLSLDYRCFNSAASSTKHYLDLTTWQVVEPLRQAA